MSSILHKFCQTDSFCYCLCGRLFPYTSVPSRQCLNKRQLCTSCSSKMKLRLSSGKSQWFFFFFLKLYSFLTLYFALTPCQFCHMINSPPQKYLSAVQILFGSWKWKDFESNGCNSWMEKPNFFPSNTSQIKALRHSPIHYSCKMIKIASLSKPLQT